jgi:D-alanyl-D-alanine carboxypeptidase (penicillin-binding protein 5/6)
MKIHSFKYLWVGMLFLALYFLTLSSEAFSEATKKSKKIKAPKATQALKKGLPPQEIQGSPKDQGVLHLDVRSAVLMDALTGQVLYEQNPNLRIPPASFVKVMTLYVIYDALRAGQIKKDDWVTVSDTAWRRAWKTDSSKMFIKVGERVKVEDLMKGVAIASGNDACVALAEHLSGSEEAFVSKMNEKAKLLGLKDSQFKNSDGLPAEDQYITALDMALLSKRYIEDHPEAITFHSTVEFEYNGIRQGNRNTLLQKNIGVDGLKTGHIKESGYHLTATAKRDGQRMIAVVMGCDRIRKRAEAAQNLLEYGFKNFVTVEAVKKSTAFGPIRIKRGKVNELSLTPAEEGRVTVVKGKENSIAVTPELPKFLTAPIQKGQVVGKVLIQNESKVVKEINLLSASDVPKSFLPSWPVILAGIFGLIVMGLIGFWWMRRPKRKKF